MSLKLNRAIDLAAYSQAALSQAGISTNGTIYANWCNSSFTEGGILYLQARDAIYTTGAHGTAIGRRLVFRADPELRIVAGRGLARDATVDAIDVKHWYQGTYNPATRTQPLYINVFSGDQLRRVDPDTLIFSPNPFNGPRGAFKTGGSNGLGTSEDGYWTGTQVQGIFFEGLTDGIPGETVVTGPNVFPWGLFWGPCSGKLNGSSFNNSFGWADVYSTTLVGLPGGSPVPAAFPCFVTSSPGASIHTEPPIAGDTFQWTPAGFIQDPDGTPAAPKGELFFHSDKMLGGSSSPAAGALGRFYVRWSDFNPFGRPSAAGVPSRTHGRIRLTSRIFCALNPQFGIAGQAQNRNNGGGASCLAWDPLRRQVMVTAHYEAGAFNVSGTAAKHSLAWFNRAVDPVVLSAPAARSVPRTADVVPFDSYVGGDLGEPAGGQVVNFALTRRSSEGELVTVAGGAGSSSTLAHPPIDTDPAGQPELALLADGVPLVLGVDYTVTAATGVLTWGTSQAGRTVLATYKHRQTGATPAHGALLVSTTVADEGGNARTEVAYPDDDDLVGTLDALAGTLG